jgi:hypothetical protein
MSKEPLSFVTFGLLGKLVPTCHCRFTTDITIRRIAEPDLVPSVLSPGSRPFFEDDDFTREIPENFTVMTEAHIDDFVEYNRQAALNAMEAGLDDLEIHGANGYVSIKARSDKPKANRQPVAH